MSSDLEKIAKKGSPAYFDLPSNPDEPNSLFNDPWLHKILLLIFWIVGLTIFILLQFGLVYLTISGLLAIFYNTRTRLKLIGEPSAYSVRNPQQEKIMGTFDDKDMVPLILVS
jgi:hypothetical protein